MERTEQLVLVWLTGALVAVAIVLFIPSVTSPMDERPDENRTMVEVGENGTRLWPYVNAEPTTENPRGSINVVFYGDHVRVRYLLMAKSGAKFGEVPELTVENESDEDAVIEARNDSENGTIEAENGTENATNRSELDRADGTYVGWKDGVGADRYTYVEFEGNESGTWIKQRYQLHYGDYYGKQYHLRVFEPPDRRENWTAVQAHTEHWDWFVLTHTVDSLAEARTSVELDFMGREFVDDVHREYHYNGDTYDADGWSTVVRLAVVAPVLGLAAASTSRRALATVRRWASEAPARNGYRIALFASLALVVLGVRAGGIVFERFVPIHRFWVRRLLYPFLVAGVPLCAYTFGRRLERTDGFLLAATGFGAGVLLDYAYLNIAVLPVEIVLHRLLLAVAAGSLAAGAAMPDDGPRVNRHVAIGLLLWVAMIAAVQLL